MTKPPKKNSYQSPLEKHPKYVRAIGMVSIENASLESMLGELLGAILGIRLQIAHTLFFTPKSGMARLDLLANVLDESLPKHPELRTRVRAIIKRSRTAIGKRHDVIHSLWAENEYEGPPIARISFPSWAGGEVPITTLTDLVRDFRGLIEEVEPLINEVQHARGWGYFPWGEHVPFLEKPE
ncbi:MAG TPA: hypothetical protein VK522_15545 [Pseudolabrys sp.]|nr:hypothetical protein [Pseudolabrys sp.]